MNGGDRRTIRRIHARITIHGGGGRDRCLGIWRRFGGSRDFSPAAAKLEMSSRKEREREDRWSVGSVASRL